MRSKFWFRAISVLVALVAASIVAAPATAGLAEWQAAVAAGTPAGYINTNITSPIVADIGTYSETTGGGMSYEFIVNATNDGVSSALMGTAQTPAAAERAGLKWEQWNDTLNYGTTAFGVADFDSGVANTPNVDTHVVFVNNGVDTLLYVNGTLATTILGSSPALSGMVGIGQVYNPPGTNFDPLVGTILGVAVYDDALSAAEIGAHFQAFVPEPGSWVLAVAAAGMLASRRRA
jgi:hypothetical protein